jgi:KaiC/GvpD/RAD55 family RecA-like ATPase
MADADDSSRLSTGVDLLDQGLGGGIPTGGLVAVSAPPRAQSEPLLYALAAENPTRYLSTLRPSQEVEESIAPHVESWQATDIDVRRVDGDDILGDPETYFQGLDPESVVVVDPATELEQGERARYHNFLDSCRQAVRMTDSAAVLHCHENTPSVLRRDLTLARADQIWDVRVEYVGGNLRTRLGVTKARGGVPFGLLDLSFDRGEVTASAGRD